MNSKSVSLGEDSEDDVKPIVKAKRPQKEESSARKRVKKEDEDVKPEINAVVDDDIKPRCIRFSPLHCSVIWTDLQGSLAGVHLELVSKMPFPRFTSTLPMMKKTTTSTPGTFLSPLMRINTR